MLIQKKIEGKTLFISQLGQAQSLFFFSHVTAVWNCELLDTTAKLPTSSLVRMKMIAIHSRFKFTPCFLQYYLIISFSIALFPFVSVLPMLYHSPLIYTHKRIAIHRNLEIHS